MVSTNQLTLFFTATTQMGLTDLQRIALGTEGLVTFNDFADFKEDELKIAFINVRSGISGSPRIDLVPAIILNGTELSPEIPAIAAFPGVRAVPIPAKSTSRLLVASIAYHYYCDTNRTVTAANMHFNNVLRDFYIEWKAILQMAKQETTTKLPTLSKMNPPLKWCESFRNYLYSTFGVRKVPLLYVIRESVEVTPEAAPTPPGDLNLVYDPLLLNKAYGSSG